MRTVKELADLAGITIRTLHHYDRIGLLDPSARTPAGYRLYDHDDLLRLQQILVWRALGFGLADIAAILDDPDYDLAQSLVTQRAQLAERVEELSLVVKRLDEALVEVQGGPPIAEDTMFEGFDNSEYQAEAEECWGDTDAWRQSQARQRSWTDEDRQRLASEGEELARRMAAAFTAGVPADSGAGVALAEEARRAIDREFYDCSKEMHRNLGEMYVADPRFTAYYDAHAEGLAVWLHDAIMANAER